MVVHEVTERTLADYVRQQATTGYTALSRLVSSKIDLSMGRLFLVMPEDLVVERVENWNWDPGHVDAVAADNILAHLIRAHLMITGSRVLIQDFERSRSDPSFEDDPLRVFYGESMYWELQGSDTPEDRIRQCIGDASRWPWLAYFCKARRGRSRLITDDDLEEAATHLVGIAAQALHDSYAVWWRTDLQSFPIV